MAKIVRLTESDLTRIVRRVMKEQPAQPVETDYQLAEDVFNEIKSAMSGLGTDEDKILKALYKLQPTTSGGWENSVRQQRANYEELMTMIRKEGFRTLVDWLKTDLSNKYTKSGGSLSKFITSPYEKDTEILEYAQKLEKLLKGESEYL